jgi:TrmH family RNA methyltransferase
MIRVADAVGADLVALSDNSVDPTNGKCVRASTGSVFHLPIISAGPTAAAIAAFQAAGLTVIAADVAGDSLELFDAADSGVLAGPTVWLLGNEAHGLPVQVRNLADRTVRIPILGRAESLNLATAGAVCMYTSIRELGRAGLL